MRKLKKMRKSTKYNKVDWTKAPEIKKKVEKLIVDLNISWVKRKNIHYFKSKNSKARAYARIWGLSRIWQIALKKEPHYIIEVLTENFDKLSEFEKDKVLLHEITHIPKNFSGSLIPHYKKGKRKFKDLVHELVQKYNKL